jgi:peptidoglycan hydrolase-like protein with peptidoglycan-binding domain
MTAVVALAAGAALIAVAEARGLGQHSAAPANGMPAAQTGQMQYGQATQREADMSTVRQVQQHLRAQGLYRGQIDGLFGPQTQQALSEFQQRNGLPQTATLDDATMNRIQDNRAIGVGSSTPPTFTAPAAPAQSPTLGSGGSALPGNQNQRY